MAHEIGDHRRTELWEACRELADFGADILSREDQPGVNAIRRARENLLAVYGNKESTEENTFTEPIKKFCVECLKGARADSADVDRIGDILSNWNLSELGEEIADKVNGVPSLNSLKSANDFDEDPMRYTWYPYIPCGEYTILAAAGGTGKGMAACLIAAYLSKGIDLPEDKRCPDYLRAFPYREPQNVLFISSEDKGGEIKTRLRVSHADLSKVFILDKDNSSGLDLSTGEGLERLRGYIEKSAARLVIIDPVQAFIGAETDMNRGAKMRSILSGFSRLAGDTDSSVLLIAHTNKKPQEMDMNAGILGSVENVNASRSTLQIRIDPEENDPRTNLRLIIHTKVNNAPLGRSVRFEIGEEAHVVNGETIYQAGGRFVTDNLYSDVTKEVFEEAIRRRVSARELLSMRRYEETEFDSLMDALRDKAEELRKDGKRSALYLYEDIDGFAWAGKRPADALKRVAAKLIGEGIAVKGNEQVKRTEQGTVKKGRGFRLTLCK